MRGRSHVGYLSLVVIAACWPPTGRRSVCYTVSGVARARRSITTASLLQRFEPGQIYAMLTGA
jgi:hypothetical protein